MPKKQEGLDILTLTPIDDCSLTVEIDLPPAVAFAGGAAAASDSDDEEGACWDVADAQAYAQWEVRRVQKRPPPMVSSVSFGGAPSMCVGDDGEVCYDVPPRHLARWC